MAIYNVGHRPFEKIEPNDPKLASGFKSAHMVFNLS